jgi:hypothetical protein
VGWFFAEMGPRFPPDSVRVLEVGAVDFGELKVWVLFKTSMVIEFNHVGVFES